MKFTERFFKFPIIMYDSISVDTILAKEEHELEEFQEIREARKPDHCIGFAAIPYTEFRNNKVSYMETYIKGTTFDELKERREFEHTRITSDNYGEFTCAWGMKKFEDKLNIFMERIEENINQIAPSKVEK